MPLCRDKQAAQTMLHELETKAERRAVGRIDAYDDHRKRPLAEHLAAFERHLLAKGDSPKRADMTLPRVRAVCDGCGCRLLTDFSAAAVSQWLAERRAGKTAAAVSVVGMAKSYAEIAQRFGVSVATVNYWRRMGAPIQRRRPNDLAAIARWRAEREAELDALSIATSNGYLTAIKSLCRGSAMHPSKGPASVCRGISRQTATASKERPPKSVSIPLN